MKQNVDFDVPFFYLDVIFLFPDNYWIFIKLPDTRPICGKLRTSVSTFATSRRIGIIAGSDRCTWYNTVLRYAL